jgi:hypothetical protein
MTILSYNYKYYMFQDLITWSSLQAVRTFRLTLAPYKSKIKFPGPNHRRLVVWNGFLHVWDIISIHQTDILGIDSLSEFCIPVVQ